MNKIVPFFGATLQGNYSKLLKTSMDNGLTVSAVNKTLRYINSACPRRDEFVKIFYKNASKQSEFSGCTNFDSGIILQNNEKIMIKGINSSIRNPRDLFYFFAVAAKKLARGEITPDKIEIVKKNLF